MNQRVHLCINGCLTLKFSGSWKTVICSSSLCSSLDPVEFPPSGEIGMVDRSTGEAGFTLCVGASRDVVAIADF